MTITSKNNTTYDYCYFSVNDSDKYIPGLIGLDLFSDEFTIKPIYHLGNKSLDPNIFKVVYNLHVKHTVENLLRSLEVKYIYFAKLITLTDEDNTIPKEIYGTLHIKRSHRNPEYDRLHPI